MIEVSKEEYRKSLKDSCIVTWGEKMFPILNLFGSIQCVNFGSWLNISGNLEKAKMLFLLKRIKLYTYNSNYFVYYNNIRELEVILEILQMMSKTELKYYTTEVHINYEKEDVGTLFFKKLISKEYFYRLVSERIKND